MHIKINIKKLKKKEEKILMNLVERLNKLIK